MGTAPEFSFLGHRGGNFDCAYINGGFITVKTAPADVDVILQTMEPFFAMGIDSIYDTYSVHLHFWCEGFPGGMSDFRRFFQYVRPQDAAPKGLTEETRKGIVRIKL